MYSVRGVTPLLGTTVECCHSKDVSWTQVCPIVKAGDSRAAHCTIQTTRSDVEGEIINHQAARSFSPSHSEHFLIKIIVNIIDVRGWGRTWREKNPWCMQIWYLQIQFKIYLVAHAGSVSSSVVSFNHRRPFTFFKLWIHWDLYFYFGWEVALETSAKVAYRER